MDIKDSYLHGTVGVVKSISVSADKLTYNLADINNTAKTITLPLATTTANGLMSKDDKIAINSLGNYVTLNTDQEITGIKTFTKQQKFTAAKGTAPFQVTSDTKVTSLNADLLDGYHSVSYLPYTAYNCQQGCLVKTDIPTNSNAMVTFTIKGNSFSSNSIFTTGEFHNFASGDRIQAYGAYHHGYNFGNIIVFCYNEYVHIWFKQLINYQSFIVTVYATSASPNNTNRVTSITNAALPTTGITRKVEITPRIGLNSTNYTSYINESNFPGLNKTGTVTSVTVTGAYGLSGTGTITSSGTITLTNSGVRNVSINGNYLRVNTNGTNADLTIPYATTANQLKNTSISDSNTAASGQNLKWYSQVNQSSGYAGANYGFPASNNANGILWLGTHPGPYGWQMGFSSNGHIYARYISNNKFPTDANGGSWREIAFTDSSIIGNATSADKLKTKRKLWGQDFDGTADVSGDMIGVGTVNKVFKIVGGTNNALLNATSVSATIDYLHIYVSSNTTSNSNIRPLVLQNGYGNVGIGVTQPAQKLEVNGNVKATSFIGNLDGTYVNKLTNYEIATTIGSIATTDSLNTALGKLEFKTDFIYNDLFGTDNDDVINKWHEIVDFIDSVKEGTDITDEFVTRKTDQTITGAKSFSTVVNITGTSNFAEGIRLHHYDGISSLWFGAVNNHGYNPGMWGISVNSNGMRFRGTNSTTGTSASDYVNIIHGGNVGIGTTNPLQKLHVNGNILAAKFVTSGGTSSQFVKGDGSLDSNTYATTTQLGQYLPLSGGTMTGPITLTSGSANTFDKTALSFIYKSGTEQARIGTDSSNGLGLYSKGTIYIRPNMSSFSGTPTQGLIISDAKFTYNTYPVLHSNNYVNYITPSYILEKLKTVDGAGSELDADTIDGLHASDFKRTWNGYAGGTYIGWIKIIEWTITQANNFSPQSFILQVYRVYASPSSESYTLAFNFGWNSANIVQLNGNKGSRIIENFRVTKTADGLKYFVEMYVNTSYTTYQNPCYFTISNYKSFVGALVCAVQSETVTELCKITTSPNNIVAPGYVKQGSQDTYVLLGGGGHKAISDFATSEHNHDNRYVQLNGSSVMSGDLVLSLKDADRFIVFSYPATINPTSNSWRTGVLGSGNGEANYYVVQYQKVNIDSSTWNTAFRIGQTTGNVTFTNNITIGDKINYHAGNLTPKTVILSTSAQTYLIAGDTNYTLQMPSTDPYTSARIPTAHTHYATTYKDSRNEAMTPTQGVAVNGIAIDFKTKANGVAGSGTYCGLVTFDPYSDVSGGYPLQLGFNTGADSTNTNDVYIRTAKDSNTWNAWRTIINNVNYTTYTVTKDGTGATGTWDISITGNAGSASTSAKLSSTTIISSKEFSLSNASWTDTEYTFASLATGTYAVQITSGTDLVASGIMSVYKNLSDTAGDEIPLHVYGTAGWRPYLRTYANKLQISSNDTISTARTVTIKIAQIL